MTKCKNTKLNTFACHRILSEDQLCCLVLTFYLSYFNIVISLLFKDDIFTTSTAKPVPKAPDKSKKTPPAKETTTAPDSSNIFDDPLNVLGGN